jgi:F-type H+-transporting ATPase subunit delta
VIEPTTLARPYARAAFEHARAAAALPTWQAALAQLAAASAEPRVAALLRDPNKTAGQRASALKTLLGDDAPDGIGNLLAIMSDNG